ncbi:MAG TPA: Smr/MutS family protein [Bauldia sp.]|nr:Smr/MutS family protein [Bauldia sp.]
MSRKRTPSGDELELWQKVTETVAPLEPQKLRSARTATDKPKPPEPRKKATPPVAPFAAVKPPPPKTPPSLAPLDRRTRSRVARGNVAIDRRIDLHGLTQAAAERRLDTFLHDAQSDGAKVVLVITGKGKAGDDARGSERGVLRRIVPLWLGSPALRGVVIGFEEAARNHGGAGALYVRIRRPR